MLAEDGSPPLSKRQQKKLAKKDWNAQKKAERKIAKKQSAKADSAKRKAQIDEALAKMTPEELEEHRKKAYAKSQVILLWLDSLLKSIKTSIGNSINWSGFMTRCKLKVLLFP